NLAEPPPLEPLLNLGRPEPQPAADLEAGHVATLSPIDDRPRSEAEQLTELARRQKPLRHSVDSAPCRSSNSTTKKPSTRCKPSLVPVSRSRSPTAILNFTE